MPGAAALEEVCRNEAALSATAGLLRAPAAEVPERVGSLLKEIRQLKKQLAAGVKGGGVGVEELLEGAAEVEGTKVVVAEVPEASASPASMRELIDQLRRKGAPVAVMLAGRQAEDRVTLIAGLSRDLVQRGLDAVQWVRMVAAKVQGGGGGRPDMAQAGGKDAQNLPEALDTARSSIEEMLAG